MIAMKRAVAARRGNRRMTLFVVPVLSDAPERLAGGQAGGADGGQQPGQGADDDGGGQPSGPGFGRDDEELAVALGVDGGGGGADGDSRRAAGQGRQDRLGQELDADLAAGGAQRRRSPISERRSRTEMTMMLATPIAPTSGATAPSPRNRVSRAPAASARAVSAAEGWETSTWFGFSGLAWSPSRLSTRVVAAWVSTVRT